MHRFALLALAAIALAASPSPSQAGFVPVYTGQSGNDFNYELQFSTAMNSTLIAGDFLTLYDLAGNSGSFTVTAPANFTVTKNLLGLTPSGVNVTDSPTLYNVTFTYTGPTLNTSTVFNVAINFPGATVKTGLYSARDQVPLGPNDQRGPVLVPVPEPASITLMGLGATATLFALRRRLPRKA